MNPTLLLPALLLGALSSLSAAPITGETLNIGTAPSTGGSNSLSSQYSGAIGSSNYVSPWRSLLVGMSNSIYSGSNMMAIGSSNTAGYNGVANSLLVGVSNGGSSWLATSAFIGSYNATGSPSQAATDSLVVGNTNTAAVNASLVAGKNNYVTGQKYVLGQGLISDVANVQVVLGTYNAPPVAGQLLVIGNGTSSAAADRQNAFEVYSDGTVKLPKRQGDLRMGRFGNPADQ